jgi:hypothetical protein
MFDEDWSEDVEQKKKGFKISRKYSSLTGKKFFAKLTWKISRKKLSFSFLEIFML